MSSFVYLNWLVYYFIQIGKNDRKPALINVYFN